jgi:ribosomal protein S17E
MYFKIIVPFFLITTTYAFLPKLPSSLQNILTSRAILTTFGERISEEFLTNNNIIRDVLIDHSKNQLNFDIFYLIILVTILQNATPNLEKLEKVTWFSDMRKKTNIFVLVIMIIFNRNVENAI